MKKTNNYSGFTLIETIIYIALLGLIISGVLPVTFHLLASDSSLNDKATVQSEANFVLRKINWALSGAASTLIGGPSCSRTLHVVRYDGAIVDFRHLASSSAIEISHDDGVTYNPITTANVLAACLNFQAVTVGSINGIAATTTLNGIDFGITKYLR